MKAICCREFVTPTRSHFRDSQVCFELDLRYVEINNPVNFRRFGESGSHVCHVECILNGKCVGSNML